LEAAAFFFIWQPLSMAQALRSIGPVLVAAILLASSVVAESAIQEFGDWRLHADAPRPYLAYEPAPGTSLRIHCQEIDGYPTPPYVRTAYFLSANLVVRNADRYRNQPSVTVTYAIGENG
jgi:hypothetical protein